MFAFARKGRWMAWGISTAALVFVSLFWWISIHNPRIYFLERHPPAEWIVYPKPTSAMQYICADLNTEFSNTFVLETIPPRATVTIRAMQHFSLRLNGVEIEAPKNLSNWKIPAAWDVSSALRMGTNELSVKVFNSNGFPALWLTLEAGKIRVISNDGWDASMLGAAWRKARLASAQWEFQPGNPLAGGTRPWPALTNHWPTYLFFALLSWMLFSHGKKWRANQQTHDDPDQINASRRLTTLGLRVVGALWLILFLNNVSQLYFRVGFDSSAHLDYIDFLKTHWRLPLASDGWEMYQPPLYYTLAAIPALVIQTHGFSVDSIQAIRMFGMVIGLAQVTLIFLSLRLLFPKKPGVQLFGLIFAAALPMNLYISHYITNEGLCGTLATAALYLCLKILISEQASPRLYVWLGIVLGAALLTKFTTVILVPFIGFVLLVKWFSQRGKNDWKGLGPIAATLLITFVVCGWHYIRVWKHFGGFLAGNWTGVMGFYYWLENGFLTSGYFFRMGRCFTYPWFSGFYSFSDGMYSTLWGDGCLGGVTAIADRPPWNDGLMAAGFLLALLPTALIVCGTAKAFWNLIRKPSLVWFLLIGMAVATVAATIYMSLQLPYCAQIKAFYGLIAILPLCAFACKGWELLLSRSKFLISAGAILFGVWAMNSYASFWIRSWSPNTQEIVGRTLLQQGNKNLVLEHYTRAFQNSPDNLQLRKSMALVLANSGRLPEAKQMLESIIKDDPNFAEARLFLAQILVGENHLDKALQETEATIQVSPDWIAGYSLRQDLLRKAGRFAEAAAVAREGLRINPVDLHLQQETADRFMQAGDSNNAAIHQRAVGILKPVLPASK